MLEYLAYVRKARSVKRARAEIDFPISKTSMLLHTFCATPLISNECFGSWFLVLGLSTLSETWRWYGVESIRIHFPPSYLEPSSGTTTYRSAKPLSPPPGLFFSSSLD
jgi:hypothetical protein